MNQQNSANYQFTCHLDFGETSALVIIEKSAEGYSVRPVELAQESRDEHAPVFLGVVDGGQVVIMDPVSKAVTLQGDYPGSAFAPYAYPGQDGLHLWYTNDGDKETGNDVLNCGDNGASVTVVGMGNAAEEINVLKTLCLGRGHHVVTITAPSATQPQVPHKAFVSNLLDGTISVLGNDPAKGDEYLKVLDMINLCEAEKEKEGACCPNNAFPHGKAYSSVTGKIYNLNNGYGTVAVINPVSHEIESRIPLKKCSNLLLSPDGRYLIGKGADRKSDPDHVKGRLAVLDVVKGEVVETLDLHDIYPSTYRFSTDGSQLFVTTAATGQGDQRGNLNKDTVLVYDTTQLPKLVLEKTLKVGLADNGRRPFAYRVERGRIQTLFFPNPTDGTLTLVDGDSLETISTLTVSDKPIKELNFSFWNDVVHGC